MTGWQVKKGNWTFNYAEQMVDALPPAGLKAAVDRFYVHARARGLPIASLILGEGRDTENFPADAWQLPGGGPENRLASALNRVRFALEGTAGHLRWRCFRLLLGAAADWQPEDAYFGGDLELGCHQANAVGSSRRRDPDAVFGRGVPPSGW